MKTQFTTAKWFVTMAAAAGLAFSGVRPATAHGGGGGMGGGMSHASSNGGGRNLSSMARTPLNLGSKNVTLTKLNSTSVKNSSLKLTTVGTTGNSTTNINQPNTGGQGSVSGTGTTGTGSAISRFPTGPIRGISGLAGGSGSTGTTGAGGAISGFPTGPIRRISGLAGGNGGTGNGGSGTCGTGGGSGSGGTGGMGNGWGNCYPFGGFGLWPLLTGFGGLGGFGGYGGGYSAGSYGGTTMVADPSATTAPVAAVPTNSVAKPAATVTGVDLQLLDVRMLDNGDATQQIGPRYRVTFRNAGTSPVDHDFNVALVAADDANLTTNLPTIESRISSVGTGDVKTVDLRLPATAFDMGQDSHSEFAKLVVVVDSHGEVNDVNRDNNMASVDRTAVQPAT